MYRTQCVLALLSLCAGLVNSFSWEMVIRTYDRLNFYDMHGTLTHTEEVAPAFIKTITYDPVHNRVLYSDTHRIYSFKIASKTIETLVTNTKIIKSLAYDPATATLFWNEDFARINSISLKTGLISTTNDEQFILNSMYPMTTVDICKGYLYWIGADLTTKRCRFDGSEKETVTGAVNLIDYRIDIDQHAQTRYWFDYRVKSIKCADLNAVNSSTVYQVLQLRPDKEKHLLTFSKEHIYLAICSRRLVKCSFWKIPRNTPNDIDLLIEANLFIEREDDKLWGIAAKYSIEDLNQGTQNCERVKSLLPNNNVSLDESLLCIHGTKVSEEFRCDCTQGYSGESCDVPV